MKKIIAVTFSMSCLALAIACGSHTPPNPNPTPPSPTAPPAAAYDNNRTLRTAGTHLTLLDGTPFNFDQGVQCCDAVPEVANSRWPLASESQMDFFKGYGLNAVAFRLGPFYGSPDFETEWSDIGGAYTGTPGNITFQFNQAFDDKVVALVQHAYDNKMWVEINVIDTWYCKRASSKQGFRDQQMPWPQADIDACGIQMTQVQEDYLRHYVKLLGKFPNVIWATDNEGGEIRGTKREWYVSVYNITRDEEAKNGFPVHLIGINNEDFGDGPFEYVSTHARAALLAPLWGKWTLNNERNPEFPPNQEVNNFKQARDLGLAYSFWRAGMSNDQAYETLRGYKAVIEGSGVIVGCYAPAAEDPLWDTVPASATGPKDRDHFTPEAGTREAVAQAKSALGPMTGAGHDAMLVALAAKLREDGWCASKTSDAVTLMSQSNKNVGYEFHAVSYVDDTWDSRDKVNPTTKWTYLGSISGPVACTGSVPTVTRLDCKMTQAFGEIDCTPKAGGQVIRPEGDPERAACEKKAMDPLGGYPTHMLASSTLTLQTTGNPMTVVAKGKGTGTLTCTFPNTGSDNYCNPPSGLAVSKT